MKKYIFLALLFSLLLNAKYINNNPETIKSAIKNIYNYINKKEYGKLSSKYIDKKYGLVVLYRPGTSDSLEIIRNLKSKKSRSILGYTAFMHKVKYATKFKWSEPNYSCEKETWSSRGYFLKKIEKINKIKSVQKIQKIVGNSATRVDNINFYETKLYHLTDTVNDINIYLKFKNKKWIIVIIDLSSSDCSA